MRLFKQKSPRSSKPSPSADLSILDAIDRTQATIEFAIDGTILVANDNFLSVVGYDLDEIQGQHHSLFVDPSYAQSDAYGEFWDNLRAGQAFTDQFPRLAKSGETVWIQATYAPVFDANNVVTKVIKLATDVTSRRHSIEMISDALKQIANGNLSYRLDTGKMSDFIEIANTFNDSISQLETTLCSVVSVSTRVTETASEIRDSARELATRTESQASTLETTTAAMEELTTTARTATSDAEKVEKIVSEARKTAENSGVVVGDAVKAMSEIEESSNAISRIIAVIDDIAFQTNLLALNAGVEAARASEAGRGFGVVATEVRGLAHRTTEAAQEIKDLIGESSQFVATGVGLVRRAGDELKVIIERVTDVSNHISRIANSANEQLLTQEEITQGFAQLDQMTQQNAAMVEENTASSSLLANEAENLAGEISVFNISDTPNATQKPEGDADPMAQWGYESGQSAPTSEDPRLAVG